MSFNVDVAENIDEKIWKENLEKSPFSTAYQIPEFLKAYTETFNSKPIFITVKNSEDKIVGQLSSLIHTKFFWAGSNIFSKTLSSKLNLGTTYWWKYGPIIHDSENYENIMFTILDTIDSIAEKNNVTFIRGSFPPMAKQPAQEMLEKRGFEVTKWSTYLTNLEQNSDDLLVSLDKSVRYDIRKAEKNNLDLEIADNLSSLIEYGKMKFLVKERDGHRRDSDSTYREKEWENMHKKGFAKLFLARHKGNPLSGILCFSYNKNVVQHGVVNYSDSKLQGGSFITWNALKWFIENKMQTFDMSGINPNPESKKEERIDFFKSKWGGKQFDYFRIMKIVHKKKAKISFGLRDPRKILTKISS